LKNEGDYAVNVSRFEEHVIYNIIYSNGSDIGYESLPSIDAMGDDYLIELEPNESLSVPVHGNLLQKAIILYLQSILLVTIFLQNHTGTELSDPIT
jgi:hypothetical protein